jgi:MFS family permease
VLSLTVLTLALTAATAMRGIFSPLQESAKLALQLSDFQVSLLQGTAAALPIALFSVPLGRAVDRSNRVRLLIAMTAVAALGTVLTVFAQGFVSLFVARMLAGLGGVLALPIAISIAADLSSVERRGRALLPLGFGNFAGAAAGFALGGYLFGVLGARPLFGTLAPWRGVHLLFAIGAVVVLLLLFLLREPARHEVSSAADSSMRAELLELWNRRKVLLPLFIGQVTVCMADTAAYIWAAPVLTRDYRQQPQQFAGWMGLVLLAGGLFGSLLGGVAADLGHRSRMRGGILIGAVVAAALSIPASFFPLMPNVTGFAWLLAVLLVCGSVTGLVTATAIAVLLPNELRGVCLGAFVVVGAIIGLGIGPTLVTGVSQLLGGESQVGLALAVTGVITSVGTLLGFWLALRAARTLPQVPHGA